MYRNDDPEDVTGSIEHALRAVLAADDAGRKLKNSKQKQPYNVDYPTWIQQMATDNVISQDEAKLLLASSEATRRVIMVDDFPNDVLHSAAGAR